MDNLGSGTYETFERDPVKYERYEEVSTGKVIGRFLSCVGYLSSIKRSGKLGPHVSYGSGTRMVSLHVSESSVWWEQAGVGLLRDASKLLTEVNAMASSTRWKRIQMHS